jgi:hypothetical protein
MSTHWILIMRQSTSSLSGAGELMSVVQTTMIAKLPYTALRDAIFAHPTMAEGLTVLFAAAPAMRAKTSSEIAALRMSLERKGVEDVSRHQCTFC